MIGHISWNIQPTSTTSSLNRLVKTTVYSQDQPFHFSAAIKCWDTEMVSECEISSAVKEHSAMLSTIHAK